MGSVDRKPVYATEEERQAAAKAARARSKAKTKNMTVDADLVEKMERLCDILEARFGFRPTISQAIRHLITEVTK